MERCRPRKAASAKPQWIAFAPKPGKRGVKIIRDKTAMRFGDSISKFMIRLAHGDRIFVFLSAKYLKSAFCMNELHQIWRNCSEDGANFIDRTRITCFLAPR